MVIWLSSVKFDAFNHSFRYSHIRALVSESEISVHLTSCTYHVHSLILSSSLFPDNLNHVFYTYYSGFNNENICGGTGCVINVCELVWSTMVIVDSIIASDIFVFI